MPKVGDQSLGNGPPNPAATADARLIDIKSRVLIVARGRGKIDMEKVLTQ
jgi:hypothetical protein